MQNHRVGGTTSIMQIGCLPTSEATKASAWTGPADRPPIQAPADWPGYVADDLGTSFLRNRPMPKSTAWIEGSTAQHPLGATPRPRTPPDPPERSRPGTGKCTSQTVNRAGRHRSGEQTSVVAQVILPDLVPLFGAELPDLGGGSKAACRCSHVVLECADNREATGLPVFSLSAAAFGSIGTHGGPALETGSPGSADGCDCGFRVLKSISIGQDGGASGEPPEGGGMGAWENFCDSGNNSLDTPETPTITEG